MLFASQRGWQSPTPLPLADENHDALNQPANPAAPSFPTQPIPEDSFPLPANAEPILNKENRLYQQSDILTVGNHRIAPIAKHIASGMSNEHLFNFSTGDPLVDLTNS